MPASPTTVANTGPPPAEPSTEEQPATEGVDAYFDQLENDGFEGVIAVRNGPDITTRAFGISDRENDVPFDPETVFDIGSISKQFTAAAILHLEMEGRLSVDDTLGEHVPGLPEDKAVITLHQLLTHTASVPVGFGPDDEPVSREEFLARVGETPLVSDPGSQFLYSNAGYALLAAVIEFETGAPYETYLRTHLFEPAGMLDTGYVLPDWDDHTIAVGYDSQTGDRFGRPNEQPWDANGPYWNLLGNGGILSTAADMLRWDEALKTSEVLDAPSRAKLFAPHVALTQGAEVYYGYGWRIFPTPAGTPIIDHDGGNNVFYAHLLRFTNEDIAIYFATNSFQAEHDDLGPALATHALGFDPFASFHDEENDSTEHACGFVDIDSLPESSELVELPDSPAGRTTQLLLDLLANGDTTALLDFAENHLTDELAGDDPTLLADDIEALQAAGFSATYLLQQDDQRFHLVLQSPDAEILLSLAYDETAPGRLACVSVMA